MTPLNINTTLRIGDLTLGEVADMEEKAEKPVSEILVDLRTGAYSMKELLAFVWVVGRRENPDFTWDDARALSLDDIEIT